jgi:tetratricopeptide (TPR) repeat protein
MSEWSNSELFERAIKQYHAGLIERSAQILEALVAKAQAEGDHLELRSRANLCEAYMRLGKYDLALESATTLLARARKLGQEEFEGEAIGSLAMVIEHVDLRGRWHELKPLLVQAFQIARKHSSGYWMVQHPETLGRCSLRMGELEDALRWLQEALDAIHSGVPEPDFFRTRIYQSMSDIARLRGNLTQAVRYAESALGTAQENKEYSPHLEYMARLTLAKADWARGEKGAATKLAEEVLARAKQENWPVEEQSSSSILGDWERELGHYTTSERAARHGLELARRMKMKEDEVICLLSLGRTLELLSRKEEARDCWVLAKRLADERNYRDHLDDAGNALSQLKMRSR